VRYVYSNEIYHYGIPGMKWGIRRFQNRDGSLTKAGIRRYGTVENLERGMTKKQAAEHDEAKKAAINSGKTAEVQKFSSELTREEIAYAVQRIRDEQTLSDLRAKDVAAGQQKVKAIIDAGGQLKSAGETVKNLYNLVAQANNAFNKDHKMPIIGADDNNRKGDKPLSADDQTKLFNLEQSKKKAAREAEVEELIRTKDLDWFKKHSSEFTKEELGKAIGRQELFESEKWTGKKASTTDSNGYQKNQNQGESKKQTSDQSGSQKNTSSKDLPGGIDFTRDNEAPAPTFKSPDVSTAKTVSDSVSSGSDFVKDAKNSAPPSNYSPPKTVTSWVKDNSDTPFSQFSTVHVDNVEFTKAPQDLSDLLGRRK